MPKLTAILKNDPSPLEAWPLDEPKTIEFTVDEQHNLQDVLDALESFVADIRGDDATRILVQVFDESGTLLIDGAVKHGFNGTVNF